jgi:hypothetical protein
MTSRTVLNRHLTSSQYVNFQHRFVHGERGSLTRLLVPKVSGWLTKKIPNVNCCVNLLFCINPRKRDQHSDVFSISMIHDGIIDSQ